MSDGAPDWREVLGIDPNTPWAKEIPDGKTAGKVLTDLQSYRGTAIRPPGPDAGPEAHAEFAKKLAEKAPGIVYLPEDEKARAAVEATIWDRLGRPVDENGYAVTVEGVEIDAAKVRATMKELGLTRTQATKYLEREVVAPARAAQESRKAADAALRTEWGAGYDEKVAAAKAAALRLGVPGSALDSIPPSQLKIWANVAKSIGGEARNVADQPANPTGGLGREEMQLQVAEMRNRKEYLDGSINPALTASLRRKVMEYERALSEG